MGMFEMSPEQVVEWRQKYRDLVAPHVQGEEVIGALRLATERKTGMTELTIESPAEGEKASLVGAGVAPPS